MTRARAADDFATISQRIRELRRETTSPPLTEAGEAGGNDAQLNERERRIKERREGVPPPWAPTIFLRKPTRREIARRFWHMRADFEKRYAPYKDYQARNGRSRAQTDDA